MQIRVRGIGTQLTPERYARTGGRTYLRSVEVPVNVWGIRHRNHLGCLNVLSWRQVTPEMLFSIHSAGAGQPLYPLNAWAVTVLALTLRSMQ